MVKSAQCGSSARSHGDDDLFVCLCSTVARCKYAWNWGLPFGIDFNLTAIAQGNGIFEPVGIGQQANLYENPSQFDFMLLLCGTVFVAQTGDFCAIAQNFGGQSLHEYGDIWQAVQFLLQHWIRTQTAVKFE